MKPDLKVVAFDNNDLKSIHDYYRVMKWRIVDIECRDWKTLFIIY